MDDAMLANTRELVDSMRSIVSGKVTKLNDMNYNRWRREMELRLNGTGRWYLIAENRPDSMPDDRKHCEARLLTDLFDSCEVD